MLEEWVIDVLNEITKASKENKSVNIHITKEFVKEIAENYEATKWIEMY